MIKINMLESKAIKVVEKTNLTSLASAVAGMMFVLGVVAVSFAKTSVNSGSQRNHLRPSAEMLLENN